MPWFPVDDAFHSHPKAKKAGDEALGMWTRAGAHCMAYLTDGFVADWWVKEQPKGVVKAQRLVKAELWRRTERDGETGYQFHDWKPECTKERVLAARENARQRKAKSRESHEPSHVTGRVTDASCLVPIQSNPIQSINPLVDLGGRVTEVDAHEPPTKCPKHVNHPDPPNCRACGNAREANEAWHISRRSSDLAARREARALREGCTRCDEAGWIHGTDPTVKCLHPEAAHA